MALRSQRLRAALDALPEGISVWHAVAGGAGESSSFTLQLINKAGRQAYQGDHDVIGLRIEELVPTASESGLLASLRAAHTSGRAHQIVTEVHDGAWAGGVWESVQVPMGEDLVLSAYRNVSERVRGERLLAAAYEETAEVRATLQTALDCLHEAFALFDLVRDDDAVRVRGFSVVHANEAAAQRFGARAEDVIGLDLRELLPYASTTGLWEAVLHSLEDCAPRHHRSSVDADGTLLESWDVTIAPVGEDRVVLTWRDATLDELAMRALESSRDEAMIAATHDPLTGLPNRALARDRLAEALRDCPPDARVGVVFADLNGFKLINDTYGHAAGDAVLKATGQRLARTVRRGDTAARLSGDEFLLVLCGLPPDWDPEPFFARSRKAITEPVWVEGAVVTPSASFGMVMAGPDHGPADVDALIQRSDEEMYEAKRAAREAGTAPVRGRAPEAHDVIAGVTRGRIDVLLRLLGRLCPVDDIQVCLVDPAARRPRGPDAGQHVDLRWLRDGFLTTVPISALYDDAVFRGALSEVPDAQADPRYAHDPLVHGPAGIRFFASAPLTGPDGAGVGVLCLAAQVPHRLDDVQRRVLTEVAAELGEQVCGVVRQAA